MLSDTITILTEVSVAFLTSLFIGITQKYTHIYSRGPRGKKVVQVNGLFLCPF